MKSKIFTARPYILVVFGVLFGVGIVAGFGGIAKLNLAYGSGSVGELGGPTPNVPGVEALQNMNTAFRALAKAIQPSVVSIRIKTEAPKNSGMKKLSPQDNEMFRRFFGGGGNDSNNDEEGDGNDFGFPMPQQGPSEGLGSGVIITSDGYILTNNHVVADAAKKGGVTVKLSDKRTFTGTVVGTDPTTDLAVVKIEATGLTAAALGNSEDMQVGDWVIAVGNPLGLESTVTKGIVSSLGRSLGLPPQGNAKDQGYAIADFIQTDAAINPGNSGGGLFNVKGQVIGINAAIATSTGMFAGYGFAIPMNLAKTVAMDLIKTGKVNRGYIGVQIKAVDQTEAEALGLGSPRGVRIDNVVPGGAGEQAGLRENDIILSIDGQETNESNQLQGIIGMHHVADNVRLHLWRGGKEMDVNVKLRGRGDKLAMNDNANADAMPVPDSKPMKESARLDNIGVAVRNLTSADKEKYNATGGVYVTNVSPASEAYDRGLGNIGKVITVVGGKPIRNVNDFESAINAAKGKSIGLTVKNDKGDSRYVAIRVPND